MARVLGVLALLGLSLAGPAGAQAPKAGTLPQLPAELERVRTSLDKYRDPIVAVHDGYFSSLACVDFPVAGKSGQVPYAAGGMGVHFLNTALIGPKLDTSHPTVLIYEPDGDTLRLVAAEWFVPTEASPVRPEVFGHPLDGPMEGHHPIMSPEMHHWDLHVWLWKANPAGLFSPTNPNVRCPNRAYSFHEEAPMAIKP